MPRLAYEHKIENGKFVVPPTKTGCAVPRASLVRNLTIPSNPAPNEWKPNREPQEEDRHRLHQRIVGKRLGEAPHYYVSVGLNDGLEVKNKSYGPEPNKIPVLSEAKRHGFETEPRYSSIVGHGSRGSVLNCRSDRVYEGLRKLRRELDAHSSKIEMLTQAADHAGHEGGVQMLLEELVQLQQVIDAVQYRRLPEVRLHDTHVDNQQAVLMCNEIEGMCQHLRAASIKQHDRITRASSRCAPSSAHGCEVPGGNSARRLARWAESRAGNHDSHELATAASKLSPLEKEMVSLREQLQAVLTTNSTAWAALQHGGKAPQVEALLCTLRYLSCSVEEWKASFAGTIVHGSMQAREQHSRLKIRGETLLKDIKSAIQEVS